MDVKTLYSRLLGIHGNPGGQWRLWCKRPKTTGEKEAVAIEAILTQRVSWHNVMLATENLRMSGCFSLEGVLDCDTKRLLSMIRPSGFYRVKAERLKVLSDYILNVCGGMEKAGEMPLDCLRQGLLSLYGVGEETADDILLYSFGMPVFVVDQYTRRLAESLDLPGDLSYTGVREFFERGIGNRDCAVYQDLHALIVIDAKSGKSILNHREPLREEKK